MRNLQNLVKYVKPLINRPLPSAKLINNKLYILNTDGTYIKIKKIIEIRFLKAHSNCKRCRI